MGPHHPYKQGNYAAVREERSMEGCEVEGTLPVELAGGMYVRNGGQPALVEEEKAGDGPAYHWFDGDGMLSGVFFTADPGAPSQIAPRFVSRYILTDIFLASEALGVKEPILPSIATLLGSFRTFHLILFAILRAVFLAFCSFFTDTPVRHLSVTNTSLLWHDGRAVATCESGPPMTVTVPELETVDFWSLEGDNGEPGMRENGGMLGWMKEWTTAHPKRDPETGELMLFHCSFLPPYLHYSVIPSTAFPPTHGLPPTPRILQAPVPISAPKMLHDFAATRTHSILLDLPLSLDPRNLLSGQPVISYSPSSSTRFGVFPRHSPARVQWYEAPACIIFHTANAWDDRASSPSPKPPFASNVDGVNLVCCRLNSSRMVYSAGGLPLPEAQALQPGAKEACELYYYRFSLSSTAPLRPSHAFPLSAIPFEFPTVPQDRVVSSSKYVYGCSTKVGSFDAALGGAAKIDCLVKANVEVLVVRGKKRDEGGKGDPELPVDQRTVLEVLEQQTPRSPSRTGEDVPLRVFELPPHHYAQEASFVPRQNGQDEDDGYLLTYVFDERQLDEAGVPVPGARSELWVIDAWNMRTVVAKVKLPQRVPYGLHGHWFPPEEVQQQRKPASIRRRPVKPQS
ncbi:hypothetical protein JCM10207_000449 [Rhodosporidiobolus poonsookiae]